MQNIELKKIFYWELQKQTFEEFDYKLFEKNHINNPHILWSCYWYPLIDIKKNIPVISFDADFFDDAISLQKVNEIFLNRRIKRVQVIPELEPAYVISDFSQMILEKDKDGMNCFAYHSEQFIYDFSKSWLIYSSHEGTVAFAGEWLVNELKNNFRNFEKATSD